VNRSGSKTCALCGVELQELSFKELFGPPRELRDRYAIRRTLPQDVGTSLYQALDRREGGRPCHIQEVTTTLQDPLDRQDLEERFLIEAAAWQAVRHPHIARVTDAFVHSNRLYLVTEATEGTSLEEIVDDRRQNPSETTLLHWARQLAGVLDHLHSQAPPILLGYLSPAEFERRYRSETIAA
jgi:serine/threonine protein kinase